MDLRADCIWALKRSESVEDLRAIFANVWRKCNGNPHPDVVAVKDERKAMHESAGMDKMLHDLRGALFELKKYADTPGWVNGVGWNTLKKAKAQGVKFQMDERLEKQVRAIIRMAEPEEDLVE